MIKTFLFLITMYLLVKIVSRMFLSQNQNSKKKSKANFFYKNFQQFYGQQQQNKTEDKTNNLDEIEEAEYEDITEDEDSSSKTSG